jgi:nucleoid-associated protein YgaU
VSEAPRLVIEEIGGRRSLSLGSRALPYQRINLGGVEQARKKTRYPGNATHTIQVLGPEWGGTTIQGTWKDRFLTGCVEATGFSYLQPGGVVRARDLVRAFVELASAGVPIRVQWGDEIRRGIIATITPTWIRAEDCEYQIEFDWIGRDEPQVGVASGSEPTPEAQIQEAAAAVDQAADARPAAVSGAETARQRATQRSNREAVGQVFDALRRVRSGVQIGDQIATAATAMISSAALAINGNADANFAQTSDRPYTEQTVFDDVVSVLGVEGWRRTYTRTEQRFGAVALSVAGEQVSNVAPGAINVVTIRQGQTLRDIAQQFLGSSDAWQQIADFNDLPSSTPPVGTVVIVPAGRKRA